LRGDGATHRPHASMLPPPLGASSAQDSGDRVWNVKSGRHGRQNKHGQYHGPIAAVLHLQRIAHGSQGGTHLGNLGPRLPVVTHILEPNMEANTIGRLVAPSRGRVDCRIRTTSSRIVVTFLALPFHQSLLPHLPSRRASVGGYRFTVLHHSFRVDKCHSVHSRTGALFWTLRFGPHQDASGLPQEPRRSGLGCIGVAQGGGTWFVE
jgi:hypothetical protein